MAFLFKKKSSKEDFFDSGQSWQDYLKDNDLESAAPKFAAAGVEKLRDLFLLEDPDIKELGLTIVQFRRFKAATEEYRKTMGKRRNTVTSTPIKPKKGSSKEISAADIPQPPPEEAPVREPLALPPASPSLSSSSGLPLPATPHVIGGFDDNNTTTDDGPAAAVPEPNPGEDVYEELDRPVSEIVQATVEEFGGGIYEPPPSESNTKDTDSLHDYEDVDMEAPKGGSRRAPRVRDKELAIEPEPAALPQDPKTWTPSEVLQWLKHNSFDHFKDIFYANAFTGQQLLAITSSTFPGSQFSRDQVDELLQAVTKLRRERSSLKNTMAAFERPSESAPPIVPRGVPAPAIPATPAAIPSRPPPAVPAAPVPKDYIMKAKALYEYEAKNERQLSISVDEIVFVLDNNRAWWSVRNQQGKTGTVPSNYLEEVGDDVDADESFESADWFSGNMERSQAEDILSRQALGSFLVRRNARDHNDLTLSIKGLTGIIHLKLNAVNGRYSLGSGPTASDCGSIPELIRFHRETEIKVTGKESVLLTRSAAS